MLNSSWLQSALVSRTVANPANILNEVLGAYFDRIDTLKDRQAKQVRFEEVCFLNSYRRLLF